MTRGQFSSRPDKQRIHRTTLRTKFLFQPEAHQGSNREKDKAVEVKESDWSPLNLFNAPARQTKGPGSTHNDRTKNGSTASPVKLMPTKGVIGKKTR
jgi:hypothetical protein